MRKAILAFSLLSFAPTADAHLTPNVSLVRRADFLRQAFPSAPQFFEKVLEGHAASSIGKTGGSRASGEDARVYVARTADGKLLGTAVFIWVPSQHGPVGLGAAFDAEGRLHSAAVTDIAAEALAWVRPLLTESRLDSITGLEPGQSPEPDHIAPAGAGVMTRYFAKVIAEGIRRAQAIEKAVRAA
jgi:hypothetical protein